MGVISRKWALLFITIIGNFGRLRYSELEQKMEGISPKTLSDRLKELEKANLIKRETFAEIPPRVEYTLTPRGEELRDALVPLITWASSQDAQKLYKLV
jgi:DNA-binding HxlR family transcriptional regulator